MTRILSRFHRFLCPPPHWRSVGLKPILFNRRPGTRVPSPRQGVRAVRQDLRDAPHRSRNGSPTLGSQPRGQLERLSAPFAAVVSGTEARRAEKHRDRSAGRAARACDGSCRERDAGGIRATIPDAVAFEAEIHLSAAPGCQPGLSGPRTGKFEGGPSFPPRSTHWRSSPVFPSGVERAA